MNVDYEGRGLSNPRIVDLITTDGDRVVLVMYETRPWDGGRDQLEELDAKLNNYFGYVIDGHLAQQYPEYEGRPVRVRLDTVEEPSDDALQMAGVATRIANDHGFEFAVRLIDAADVPDVPWSEAVES